MKPLELLFLGDSLIDYGDWPRRLPQYRVISKGIPGETSGELLLRLDRAVAGHHPAAVILMTGTNDLFIGDPATTAQVQRVVDRLNHFFPETLVILTGLPPFVWPHIKEAAQALNRHLRAIANRPRGCYLDLEQSFVAADRHLFSADGVHLNEAGYQVWQHLLGLTLESLHFSASDLS
ncbi:SGNH/GDSL hydrolase family protein [Desulfofustis limnaeus]|jgi:lysophospholipase L1-like esterase|uniref:SGNH hydrolase-type esterase domain-containing protein n=1 Tax=Desulfofustis limnaeus TaxID=2740163 RepID=A0ABM7W4K6_9BACT|nr:GDSL-type esterase/lipase family protein [Desulfofustis limnaeus]MDX9894849.1 GDSL-type esterase/lipase family protein [Desulfofustis sp.]BDD85839.1 hypothetical protein DPPLL_02040 [Desulfofustis limnaeus]